MNELVASMVGRVWQLVCDDKSSAAFAVLFSALGDYGYQMVTVGEMETKPVKDTAVTTIIVSTGCGGGFGIEGL